MQLDEPDTSPAAEDDHDVLTYREAGERLRHEIALENERLHALPATGSDVATVRRRLAELEGAAERHANAQRRTQDRSAFFGPSY